ncbi:MAG: peroxiredoxin [Methyloligellaceae bacterium]
MTISVGDKLPETTFRTMTSEGPKELKTSEIFDGKKVVIFAVPGAYTPSCHNQHLPGFISNVDAIKAKGVDTVACVAVNDMFVMGAWAQETGSSDKILFLSDGNAEFTKAIGLDFDGSGFGLGTRSKRYVMVVENGQVSALSVEDAPSSVDVSSAEALLLAL